MRYFIVLLMALGVKCWSAEKQPQQPSKPKAYVYSLKTISQTPNYYCGWPTLTKTADGELLAVYSGHREWHVCPFGRIELIRSKDKGQTWGKPEVLIDTILDDRDTGICQTQKGTLLLTWFTSTYWVGHQSEKQKSNPNWQKMLAEIKSENYCYEPIKKQVKDRFGDGEKPVIDQWMVRSEDNGKTWSTPCLVPLMAPHGPIVASGGRLLWAGKDAYDGTIGFCESTDDGKTWQVISNIPPAPEQTVDNYHELHIAEAADGILIAHIRNHNETLKGEILQTESKDGGKTWTQPHSIGVACNAHPSHLLRLKDDALLMTYGDREKLRLEARISNDNGKTWSDAMILAGKLHTWDFGYPSTVQLEDGKLLTIWYEAQPDSPNTVIRQAIWTLN